MSRLTKQFDSGVGHNECHDSCMTCNGAPCELAQAMIDKLAHYEDLEEQLEKLYGGKMPLDEVVKNLNRVIQNGEEKLDYARILTNAEAEKWDKWKDLEKQGRLIELPCAVGDTVYEVQEIRKKIQEYTVISVHYSHCSILFGWELKDGKGIYSNLNGFEESAIGKTVFLTTEAAEAKLAEMEGAE